MRYLMQFLAAGAAILCTGTANADLGDQLFKLLPNDGEGGDIFGYSVAISGPPGEEVAIIGARFDDDNGMRSGSAYLFDVTTGQQLFKILADDGAIDDFFGHSVAIGGPPGMEVAIVGAFQDDSLLGSAYLYDAATGQQTFKLLADDGAANDQFGWSVAVSGTTAIAGAWADRDNGRQSGSAYLFNATTGQQTFKLLPIDGAANDRFGISVAISGSPGNEIAIVGAFRHADNGANSGAAYLFDATTGQQLFKLLADDGAVGDSFGWSVAISGSPGNEIAIVGAFNDQDNGFQSGSAYLFDVATGKQLFKLLPDDGAAEHFFGWSVAISGATAVVGAKYDDDNGRWSGSVYLFDITTGKQIAKLLPSDGAELDEFGCSVAISGSPGNEIAIVGAYFDDDLGDSSGSAYLFDADGSTGTPATLSGFDVVTGTLLDGVLADLGSPDDSYVHTRSGFGRAFTDLHHMEMHITATTTVQSPTTLDLTIQSRIDEPAGTAEIRLLNHNTAEFDPVGQYALGNTDAIDTIPDIDAANYVNGQGDIELSIKHIVFVPFLAFTFESFIDQVEIVVN